MPKTTYDEAIADVMKLKELAETRARDLVLQKVEPRLKQLVEQQLFEDASDDEPWSADAPGDEVEEASGVSSIAGAMAPADEEVQYEVSEGSEPALASLAGFTRPVTDDRFAVEVYRIQDDVQKLVVADRKEKLTESFSNRLDEAISKLEDMYAYLKESYVGDDRDAVEGKLEKSYGLVNAVKESTMKMRDLLNEDGEVLLKVNGLPDDVNVDNLSIDVITDEAGDEAAPEVGDPAADASAVPPPPEMPTAEGVEGDEVLEISEADLKAELARLRSLREGDAAPPATKGNAVPVDDFGDASSEGHPGPKGTADGGLEDIDEADEADADEDKKVDEADVQLESARRRLSRAASRLSEARGTEREDFARAMYRSAVKAYRGVRSALTEAPTKKVSAPAVTNTAGSKKVNEASKVERLTAQLAEANLLNAKLIHANKLLCIENLTKAQQAMVIDRLDEAESLREVRLISESLKQVLVGSKGSVTESATRRPSGSASRPAKTGAASSQPLTEGLETARWAQLAGLK